MPDATNKPKRKTPPPGCKPAPAPKSAFVRELLDDREITTSGGCHTVHHDATATSTAQKH